MVEKRYEDEDENDRMRRIRLIAPDLHEEILELESKWYKELEEKMADVKIVKDLILDYNPKEAKRMMKGLLKSNLRK